MADLPPVRPGYHRDVPMEAQTQTEDLESVTEWNWSGIYLLAAAASVIAGIITPVAIILWRIAL